MYIFNCLILININYMMYRAQVVGWPPVRASRRNMTVDGKFVKVAVDGAPYLRKVDLQKYNSYQQLLSALEEMFSCLTFCMFYLFS